MGKLGSRFLFLTMPDAADGEEKTKRVIANLRSGRGYRERRTRCREAVNRFMAGLWSEREGVRGIRWDNEATDESILEWVARIVLAQGAARGALVFGKFDLIQEQVLFFERRQQFASSRSALNPVVGHGGDVHDVLPMLTEAARSFLD